MAVPTYVPSNGVQAFTFPQFLAMTYLKFFFFFLVKAILTEVR